MKRLLILFLICPLFVNAQIWWLPGIDSTTFTFNEGDSLRHHLWVEYSLHFDTTVYLDTIGSGLWQIGRTLKPVFTNDTIACRGIMTDTNIVYPPNANNYFTLVIPPGVTNPLIEFWHQYETDSGHAGGLVEFSMDSGSTWINIVECLVIDNINFYTNSDTLRTGQPCFMGNSHGEQFSAFQFIDCEYIMPPPTTCDFLWTFPFNSDAIFIRFRFLSDSTVSMLSGWMIDSIRVVSQQCGGKVGKTYNESQIHIFPNPANSILEISSSNPIGELTITNLLGQTIFKQRYYGEETSIGISGLSPGVYFVRIGGCVVGKFVKE